jgi:hypothetical protein
MDMGGGLYRVSGTAVAGAAVANSGVLKYATNNNRTFKVSGYQLEAGAFDTSYIPTVASQVTRNADNAEMIGTNFSSWYNQSEGTFVADFDVLSAAAAFNKPVFVPNDGTTANRIALLVNASSQTNLLVTSGGVVQASITNSTVANNTAAKTAVAYKASDFAITTNGGAPTTQASGTVPSSLTQLDIGSQSAAATYINGHIRQIAYFNTRLADAQLQALTAPPLITTLSLDFTNGIYDA